MSGWIARFGVIRHRSIPVIAVAGLALAGVLVAPSASQAAVATFPVMNTSETPPDGVWFRNSPHQDDTNRETGFGVYAGESMSVDCYSWGDAVGPYNNHIWYRGLDVSRPTVNGHANYGYMNTHYVNDGMTADNVYPGIPDCSAPPPAATSSVSLSQGPAAPAGYRYAISLSGFSANAAVSITCYDSVSPSGFYTFSLTTDGSGSASTAAYCYSGDGPDHWVVAGGVESNHVSWGTGSSGGGGTAPGGGSSSGSGGGGSAGGTVPVNPTFNRSAAASWAVAHGNDPQAYPAECTWFVSNALWASGFAATTAWTSAGSHGSRAKNSYRPGTVDAWAVPDFKNYFRSHYSSTWTSLGSLSTNAVPTAEPGDMIFYSWDGGKTLDHVSMVVDIAAGQYPEVSEWGTPDFTVWNYAYYQLNHPTEGYSKRGWTWSQKSGTWLQTEYSGQARAWLLHINGGYYSPTF